MTSGKPEIVRHGIFKKDRIWSASRWSP